MDGYFQRTFLLIVFIIVVLGLLDKVSHIYHNDYDDFVKTIKVNGTIRKGNTVLVPITEITNQTVLETEIVPPEKSIIYVSPQTFSYMTQKTDKIYIIRGYKSYYVYININGTYYTPNLPRTKFNIMGVKIYNKTIYYVYMLPNSNGEYYFYTEILVSFLIILMIMYVIIKKQI